MITVTRRAWSPTVGLMAAVLERDGVLKFNEDQSRDDHGRWSEEGGGGAESGGGRGGGGKASTTKEPPKLKYVHPPPPLSKGGGKAGGYAADGRTNTELGDAAEADLAKQMDFHNEHPGKRQGSMDLRYDKTNYVFETKANTTYAKEYKAKPKKSEVANKREHVKKNGMRGGTMIPVVDLDKGRIHVYWRPGIGSFRLTPGSKGSAGEKGWNYAGSIKFTGKKKSITEGLAQLGFVTVQEN